MTAALVGLTVATAALTVAVLALVVWVKYLPDRVASRVLDALMGLGQPQEREAAKPAPELEPQPPNDLQTDSKSRLDELLPAAPPSRPVPGPPPRAPTGSVVARVNLFRRTAR